MSKDYYIIIYIYCFIGFLFGIYHAYKIVSEYKNVPEILIIWIILLYTSYWPMVLLIFHSGDLKIEKRKKKK